MTDTEMRQAFAAILMSQATLIRLTSRMWKASSAQAISDYAKTLEKCSQVMLDACTDKTDDART